MRNQIFTSGIAWFVFRMKLSRFIACFLFLVHSDVLGRSSEVPKKVIVFAQAETNDNIHLKEAYETHGHKVVSAFLDSSTCVDEKRGRIYLGKRSYPIKDFDLAYFRTWGKEEARHLVHTWQPVFERWGVPCVDPLQAKLYTHNKYTMMRLFCANKIPMPKTLIVRIGTPIDICLAMIRQQFEQMVVIKGEGSGGRNLSFIHLDDEQALRKELLSNYLTDGHVGPKPLVLQQYVSSKNSAGFSYHYRILVIGGEIIEAMRFTASSKQIYASNMSLGANAEMVEIGDIFSDEQQKEIIRACNFTGVNVAGVDATVVNGILYIFEVNNSPGLNLPYLLTKSKAFIDKVVSYSIEELARVK